MRQPKRPLDALMPRSRQALLATILLSPKRSWYRSDLARHLGVAPSSLTRELTTLTEAGLLRKRTEGRHAYYAVDTRLNIYPELRAIFVKTLGVVDVLREALSSAAAKQILVAFVYGSWARGTEAAESDVDVFIVSEAPLSTFARPIRRAEERLGRAVNVSAYSPPDLLRRVSERHHFLRDVIAGPKLFIIGGEDDLERLAPAQKRRAARAFSPWQPQRSGRPAIDCCPERGTTAACSRRHASRQARRRGRSWTSSSSAGAGAT